MWGSTKTGNYDQAAELVEPSELLSSSNFYIPSVVYSCSLAAVQRRRCIRKISSERSIFYLNLFRLVVSYRSAGSPYTLYNTYLHALYVSIKLHRTSRTERFEWFQTGWSERVFRSLLYSIYRHYNKMYTAVG